MPNDKKAAAKPEDGAEKSSAKSIAIVAIPAAVSLIAAVASTFSAVRAGQQAEKLERYKLARQEQLTVYDRVEKHLSSPSATNLVISSAYVQMIDDAEIKKALCETIGSVAVQTFNNLAEGDERQRFQVSLRNVRELMDDCSRTLAEGLAIRSADPALAAADEPASEVQASAATQAPLVRVVSNAAASPTGWDIDVFWCESRGEGSRTMATRTADHLAAISNSSRELGGERVGRVRLRSVRPAVQASLAPVPGNRVFGDSEEREFADAVAAELNDLLPGTNVTYSLTNRATRWYVSLFMCGSLPRAEVATRANSRRR